MIENARLAAVYEDLEKAITDYGAAQRAYAQDLRKGAHSGRSSVDFDKATRRYETREKAFNREVSDAIKATGQVPPGAVNMLNYQRYNGFHAKGLAKIISAAQSNAVMADEDVRSLKLYCYNHDITKEKE